MLKLGVGERKYLGAPCLFVIFSAIETSHWVSLEQPFGWTWGNLVSFHKVVLHSLHPLLADLILQLAMQ